jgi:hypothetical protein
MMGMNDYTPHGTSVGDHSRARKMEHHGRDLKAYCDCTTDVGI